MSRFFFFTDIDALDNQTNIDAFGPVIGSADTQFRVTSVHRPVAGAVPNAYAVCDTLVNGDDVAPSTTNGLTKGLGNRGPKENTSVGTLDDAPNERLGIGKWFDLGKVVSVHVSYQLEPVQPGMDSGTKIRFDSGLIQDQLRQSNCRFQSLLKRLILDR